MSNPEVLQTGGERGAEASEAAGEQLKKLQEQLEKKAETGGENKGERIESARKETAGAFSKEQGRENKRGGEPTARGVRHATKRQREASFEATMKQIRSEMGTPSRAFSKVIHNKTVEKVSTSVGSTVARPNAILAGSSAATFLTLAIFLVAKHYGYPLSGFETIASFIIGWSLGLIYDYASIMFRSPRRR